MDSSEHVRMESIPLRGSSTPLVTFEIYSTLDSQLIQRISSDSVSACLFIEWVPSRNHFESVIVCTVLWCMLQTYLIREHCFGDSKWFIVSSPQSVKETVWWPMLHSWIVPSFFRSLCRLPSNNPDVVVNGTSQPSVAMTTESVSRKSKTYSLFCFFLNVSEKFNNKNRLIMPNNLRLLRARLKQQV